MKRTEIRGGIEPRPFYFQPDALPLGQIDYHAYVSSHNLKEIIRIVTELVCIRNRCTCCLLRLQRYADSCQEDSSVPQAVPTVCACARARVCMCCSVCGCVVVCVCVCARACVHACVCVCVRERERESPVSLYIWHKPAESRLIRQTVF